VQLLGVDAVLGHCSWAEGAGLKRWVASYRVELECLCVEASMILPRRAGDRRPPFLLLLMLAVLMSMASAVGERADVRRVSEAPNAPRVSLPQ
jgi:hypothetical protein